MNSILVTVMIPTYNQAHLIAQTIESVLRQEYSNLQILVGDDHSSDNTEFVVKPYLADPRVQYVRNEKNLGRVGNYKNLLNTYARGEYVLNLDGDDLLCNEAFIRKAMELAAKYPDLAIIGGRHQVFRSVEELTFTSSESMQVSVWDGWDFLGKYWTTGYFSLFHLSTLYNRKKAIALDFYRLNSIASDTDSLLRLLPENSIAILDGIVGGWREHGGNESGMPKVNEQLEVLSAVGYSFDSLCAVYPSKKRLLEKTCTRMQTKIFKAGLNIFAKQARPFLSSYKKNACSSYPCLEKVFIKWRLFKVWENCRCKIKTKLGKRSCL